jgi:hypothetical protein
MNIKLNKASLFLKTNAYLKFEILNAVNLKNIFFFSGVHLPKFMTLFPEEIQMM